MILRLHALSSMLARHRVPLLPKLIKIFLRIAFGLVLPPTARIGRNVLFSYQGLGTVIHKYAVIEDNAIILTGVTLGGRSGRKGAPVVRQGAMIGAGAKILGAVTIGRYASVGANAVVLEDVPDYAVVVGIPARVVRINRPEDIPRYDVFD